MEKPLAILFVDIADSTQLYEQIGNVRASALTRKMLFHLRLAIEVNGGTVIKTLGDGLLAAFPTADDAAWASMSMIDSAPVFGLRLRVGIHYGPVVERAEDLYGDACNVAARVEHIAKPGEILATDAFVQQLTARMQARSKPLTNVSVRGKSAPIRIHELRPATPGEDTTIDSTTLGISLPKPGGEGMLVLRITYRGQTFTANRLYPRLTIGREESNDVRILSRQTSRQHAVIDFSRESFILTDHSTNGSFVRNGNAHAVALRRDSTKLGGSGLIGFGAEPSDDGQDHVASFTCDLA